jgi:hypothetical protein
VAKQVQLRKTSEHLTNGRILYVFLDVAVPDVANVLRLLGSLRNDVKAIALRLHEEALDRCAVLPLKGDREALREVREIVRVRCRRRHFEIGNMDWNEDTRW